MCLSVLPVPGVKRFLILGFMWAIILWVMLLTQKHTNTLSGKSNMYPTIWCVYVHLWHRPLPYNYRFHCRFKCLDDPVPRKEGKWIHDFYETRLFTIVIRFVHWLELFSSVANILMHTASRVWFDKHPPHFVRESTRLLIFRKLKQAAK